jgi:hypothetical protein
MRLSSFNFTWTKHNKELRFSTNTLPNKLPALPEVNFAEKNNGSKINEETTRINEDGVGQKLSLISRMSMKLVSFDERQNIQQVPLGKLHELYRGGQFLEFIKLFDIWEEGMFNSSLTDIYPNNFLPNISHSFHYSFSRNYQS